MNDLEFRRRAFAEPDCQDADFIREKTTSAGNRRLVDELQVLDSRIKGALQVPPPEGLAQRILLQQALGSDYRRRKRRSLFYALAASLLLGLAVLFAALYSRDDSWLQQDVLAHIYSELDHLNEHQNRTTQQINGVLAGYGGELTTDIGRVNYLGSCDIAGKAGVHMVLAGNQGPVTVLMLPAIAIEKSRSFSDNRFQGKLIPGPKGSVAIVGERGEDLETIKRRLARSLSWTS